MAVVPAATILPPCSAPHATTATPPHCAPADCFPTGIRRQFTASRFRRQRQYPSAGIWRTRRLNPPTGVHKITKQKVACDLLFQFAYSGMRPNQLSEWRFIQINYIILYFFIYDICFFIWFTFQYCLNALFTTLAVVFIQPEIIIRAVLNSITMNSFVVILRFYFLYF